MAAHVGSRAGERHGVRGHPPDRSVSVKALGLTALLFATWLLWSGLYTPLLIGLGAVSSLICVWVAHRMRALDTREVDLPRLRRAMTYFPWLLKEIALSNWQVIRLTLAPRLAVSPRVVRVRASQRSELGRVVYGNSITLTPGTLTMDIDGEWVTVHALTAEGARELEAGEMDARVTRLEGLG